jgi:diguanylate cyclase (GGDEF)-like protein
MAPPELEKLQDQHGLQFPLPVLDPTPQYPDHELLRLKIENDSLKQEVARLSGFKRLSLTDPLTGLHNRRYFKERLAEEISQSERTHQHLSLLVVDLDDFKQINDRFGHVRGDSALCWVADLLQENTRHHDVCCRLGGDEFVVILANTDTEECRQLVERLNQRLEDRKGMTRLPLGWSIGTATYTEDGTTVEALFDRADTDMYRTKQRKKQRRGFA